jgi:cephalosporin-C deacetylase-like acetyl esterase
MPAETATPFLDFARNTAADLRKEDRPPQSLKEWEQWRTALRASLQRAWGHFPSEACPLEPRLVGEFEREGYKVERLLFQTRPQVWMTANAYVPKKAGKSPAVLCVHGHWKGAKQDPHVQARCIGLARLGFFVLAVDAFGAGERALGTKLGEYHGEMTAATLWPMGLALTGLQLYENMRAVDYLQSRSEVEGSRIGITGASGGGNQTMYAGAWDDRLQAVVPVCSVGNYQAYLGAACCMCEVVPGALQFTEEWGLLGMVAPRALLVINASKDARQFSIAEAKKSLAAAAPIFELHGKAKHLQHATFESPHDYNQPMREAMYGWMTLHLKGEGEGAPIPEPKFTAEDPEFLRCFPNDSRPADYLTLPRFAAREAKTWLTKPLPDHREFFESEAYQMREGLARVLGPMPEELPLKLQLTDLPDAAGRVLEFNSEPGIRLTARHLAGEKKRWAILVNADGMKAGATSDVALSLQAAGWNVVCPDLRATGTQAVANDKVGRAPDHNSAEWSLWIGRPLAAQWAYDIRRTFDAVLASIESLPDEVAIVGLGPACISALLAGIEEENVQRVVLIDPLVSYVTEVPYEGQRLGSMVPGILRDVGDVQHLAALLAPRRLMISGGVLGSGKELDIPQLEEQFTYTRKIYEVLRMTAKFTLTPKLTAAKLAEKLGEES